MGHMLAKNNRNELKDALTYYKAEGHCLSLQASPFT